MNQIVRVTKPTLKVLEFISSLDGGSTWGFEIVRATGLKTGTVYPILDRLESMSWLESYWEEASERTGPRRRLYRLNQVKSEEILSLLKANTDQPLIRRSNTKPGMSQAN